MPRKYDLNTAQPVDSCDKPFPRRCPECGKIEVQPATIAYDAEVKHDGRLYTFQIPGLQVNKCAACGEILFTNVTDDQISQALREHLALLLPQQIRDAIRSLGLTQKDFGERIGVAPETISRWISGTHIQSRAMDNLMRLFFSFDTVRSALAPPSPDKNLGVLATIPIVSCETAAETEASPRTAPFAGRSAPTSTGRTRFSHRFPDIVLRRKESFRLVPTLN